MKKKNPIEMMFDGPIAMMFDGAVWTAVPYSKDEDHGDLPWVTHTGVMEIAGVRLDVVRLNTGEDLITEESLVRFVEWLETGTIAQHRAPQSAGSSNADALRRKSKSPSEKS